MSIPALDRAFEEWADLSAAFSDGYGLERLYELWGAEGPDGEPESDREWPGPGTLRFFEGWAVELDR